MEHRGDKDKVEETWQTGSYPEAALAQTAGLTLTVSMFTVNLSKLALLS